MIELATPWALACLPLPLIIYACWPKATPYARAGLIIPHFGLLNTQTKSPSLRNKLPWWLILSWALLIFAASGPRWVGEPMPITQPGHNIMLALDISGSMAMNDMQWNHRRTTRLQVVKQAAMQFVQARPADKLGLILFGTRAYIQTPLTYDKHTILVRLDEATVGLAGNSTSIGDPIGLAVKHLTHTPEQGRVIILLTDGANNSGMLSPDKATQLAQDHHIKIYTIGLGAPFSSNVDIDEDSLKKIAKGTGGQYFRATDQHSLQHIYALINQLETTPQDQLPIRPEHDYYPWPLGLSLCLLFAGLSRRLSC
jgi:Ca-activated chloride channel family protein